MALNVTLAYLKEEVRARADQQNSRFISDVELLAYINGSYSALYDKLVEAAEDYYRKEYQIPIVQGQYSYPVPEDFYKILGVDYLRSAQYYPMDKFNFREREAYLTQPTIPASKLWYVPVITRLVDDTDTIDGVNGWEEWLILDAAIKCMAKEESDPSTLMQQWKAADDRISTMRKDRDQGQPGTTTDSAGGWRGNSTRYCLMGNNIVFRAYPLRNFYGAYNYGV